MMKSMKQQGTGEHYKAVKPQFRSKPKYDIEPVGVTPEELAKSMFRNASRRLEEKKSQK